MTFHRAKVTPKQTGLATYGQGRVPGLRSEEVASPAGLRMAVFTGEPGSRSEEGLDSSTVLESLDALSSAQI